MVFASAAAARCGGGTELGLQRIRQGIFCVAPRLTRRGVRVHWFSRAAARGEIRRGVAQYG